MPFNSRSRIYIYTHINSVTFLHSQKQDESLLEDVWMLLRAGRIDEACNLCRSAGQVFIFSEKCVVVTCEVCYMFFFF